MPPYEERQFIKSALEMLGDSDKSVDCPAGGDASSVVGISAHSKFEYTVVTHPRKQIHKLERIIDHMSSLDCYQNVKKIHYLIYKPDTVVLYYVHYFISSF